MIIANPIYDVVFKRLMEDKRIAKFFISTLTGEVVDEVQVKPQEFTYTDLPSAIAVYRLDFIATIKTESGQHKKVLIEIQKAKNEVDLMRFRRYLGEQYKREDEIITETGVKKVALPIVTIYLLGFSLPEVQRAAICVQRDYIDLDTKEVLAERSHLIENLTHNCYVVQLLRITQKHQTRLDKLLSVFEQNYFVDESKIIKEYKYAIDEPDIKTMADILHYVGTDPEEKKRIEDEQEAWRTVDAMSADIREELLQTKKMLAEKENAIEAQKREIEALKLRLGEN